MASGVVWVTRHTFGAPFFESSVAAVAITAIAVAAVLAVALSIVANERVVDEGKKAFSGRLWNDKTSVFRPLLVDNALCAERWATQRNVTQSIYRVYFSMSPGALSSSPP